MKNATVKKSLILVVALLLCVTVMFAACTDDDFTKVENPQTAAPEGNGGIAVAYGDWLYYINGYTADVTADNTYSDDVLTSPRVGSVVRIKLAALEGIFEIQDDKNKTSTQKTEEIADYVRKNAQTVVPRFYYSGNTTTTQFTGLYIFNDRLYITTPNDELTAGGDKQTSQLVLASYKMDGSDEKRHYVFEDNTVQICLTEADGNVVATYLTGNKLYKLDVAAGKSTEVTVNGEDEGKGVDNAINGTPVWDVAGKCLFFIDKMYNIGKLSFGADKYDIILKNEGEVKVHEHDGVKQAEAGKISYTLTAANLGQVYYTKSDSDAPSSVNGARLYYAKDATDNKLVALNTTISSGIVWKDGRVVTSSTVKSSNPDDNSTYYKLEITKNATGEKESILIPAANDSSITLSRIEGDTLYYTANSVSYRLDLSATKRTPVAYAKSLGAAAGWAVPDFVDVTSGENTIHYVITATSGGDLTVTKFDPSDPNKTQSSPSLLLASKQDEN